MVTINSKMRVMIAVLFSVSLQQTHAQSFQDAINHLQNRRIENNTILTEALMPALSVIRQQYRLKREGKYYGKNNKPFYGETYTLAVKVPGGTIMQRSVLYPWENDEDYLRVSEGGKYTHSLFWSYQRQLTDSLWKRVELDREGSRYVKPIDGDSLIFNFEEERPDFGLAIDETLGRKQGFMVWAYSTTNASDSAMHISLRQESRVINVSADSLHYSVSPDDADRIIGGIFVVPQIERAGYIKLLMAGIAVKNKEGKWVLCLLAKSDENNKADKSDKRKKKEKKKDESEGFEPTPIN